MKTAPQKVYQLPIIGTWPNLVGLDAPLVAISWQGIFAQVFNVDLPWFIYLILGLSTWCIYLADRMIDVTRYQNHVSQTLRHRFTQQHFGKLLALLLVNSICNLVLIFHYLPRNLIIAGCITLGWIGIYYLIRLTKLRDIVTLVPREVMCGMLFALGCTIGPHAYASNPWAHPLPILIPILFFGMLCSASCILISIWEKEADVAANDRSFATSHSHIIPCLSNALACLAVNSAILACFFSTQTFLAISLSAALLRLNLHYQNQLSPSTLRVLADAVLLTPLLFIGY